MSVFSSFVTIWKLEIFLVQWYSKRLLYRCIIRGSKGSYQEVAVLSATEPRQLHQCGLVARGAVSQRIHGISTR